MHSSLRYIEKGKGYNFANPHLERYAPDHVTIYDT